MPNFNVNIEGYKCEANRIVVRMQISNLTDKGCSICKAGINFNNNYYEGFVYEDEKYPNEFHKDEFRDIYFLQYESRTFTAIFNLDCRAADKVTITFETPLGPVEKTFAL